MDYSQSKYKQQSAKIMRRTIIFFLFILYIKLSTFLVYASDQEYYINLLEYGTDSDIVKAIKSGKLTPFMKEGSKE